MGVKGFSLFFVSTLFVILSGCSDNISHSDITQITIDVKQIDQCLADANIIHPEGEHKLLKLETNDECIIGNISDIVFQDNLLYIVDDLSSCILVFNTDGRFEFKIDKRGRARNEYVEMTDVHISNNNVWVLDNIGCKIVVYDLKGAFVRSIDISSVWGHHLFVSDNNIFLVNKWSETSSGNYRFFVLDKNGKITDRQLPFTTEDCNRYFAEEKAYAVTDNVFFICYPSDNTIYQTTSDGKIEPYLYVDFGRQTMPEKHRTIGTVEGLRQDLGNKYIWGIDRISSSSRYIVLSYKFQAMPYNIIYDLKTGLHSNVNSTRVNGWYNLALTDFFVTRNYIISYRSADDLLTTYDYILKDKINPKNSFEQRVADVVKDIKYEDNGILIMYQLKNMNDE